MSTDTNLGGSYCLEPLNVTNWPAWKRRMQAVLRELKLDKYVTGDSKTRPILSTTSPTVTADDIPAWDAGEGKARTRLELAISDTEMVHILGATTAAQIWDRLCEIKETRGRLGILALRCVLYRAQANDNFDMVEHISTLCSYQSELALMSSTISEEDFSMILLASLPETWDNFTSSYFGAQGSNDKPLSASNIIPLLIDEDCHRRSHDDGTAPHALQARFKWNSNGGSSGGNGSGGGGSGDRRRETRECFNCGRKGHCRAKGGGKGGQGFGRPGSGKGRDRTHQATNNNENDVNAALEVTYMARITENLPASKLIWNLDSGTTSHISTQCASFINYTPLCNTSIQGVGPTAAVAEGRGTVQLNFKMGNQTETHLLRDVLYVPKAPNCLLSLSRFDEAGGSVSFAGGECKLKDKKGRIVGLGRKVDHLYQLDARAKLHQERAFAATRRLKTWDEWHRIFGHIGMTTLEKMHQSGVVSGLDVDESSIPSPTCTSCLGTKLSHQPFPKQVDHRSEVPGHGYFSDVWGPIRTRSIWGNRYYISFTDDASRHVTPVFMKSKDEASEKLQNHATMVERKFGKPPAWYRIDNGSEYINKETREFCARKGIELHTTAPYSPSQNGVAEHLNRTLLDLVRAMLISAGNVPPRLWDEAVLHTVYLRNRVLVNALPGKTLHEAYHGKKPDVSHLREFGCDVWVLDETQKSKLDPKATKKIFVGYMDGPRAIRYYDTNGGRIKVSRNFAFNENLEDRVDIPGNSLEEELGIDVQEDETKSVDDEEARDQQSTQSPSQDLLDTPKPPAKSSTPQSRRNSMIPRPISPLPPTSNAEPSGPTLREQNKAVDYTAGNNLKKRLTANPATPANPKKTTINITKARREKEALRSPHDSDSDRAHQGVTIEEVDDPEDLCNSPLHTASTYILEEVSNPDTSPHISFLSQSIDADTPLLAMDKNDVASHFSHPKILAFLCPFALIQIVSKYSHRFM